MFLFPIGTDRPQRRFPWMNVLLIALNIIIYLLSHPLFQSFMNNVGPGGHPLPPGMSVTGLLAVFDRFMLSPSTPQLFQFITYQFLHQNLSHIFFNMLFLYVFGNNLNEKLGNVGYLAFYLTGGILAGCGHILTSASPTLGASGAISAVTGLFLVLLPRTHIRMFVSVFFLYMDVWEIPSFFFILFKVGSDLFEQFMHTSNVAYMAHFSGFLAGVFIGLLLLFGKLVQRDHYDLLAILNRYRRRKSYEALVATGYDPFGRSIPAGPGQPTTGSILGGILGGGGGAKKVAPPVVDPRIDSLRAEIGRLVRLHELTDAAQRYLELRTIDPRQVLPAQEQLDVANQLMSTTQYAQAADAYEDFLRVYANSPNASGAGGASAPAEQIMLILGLIYARYYPRPDRARELFTAALPRLHDDAQRQLAESELAKLPQGAGGTPPGAGPAAAPA